MGGKKIQKKVRYRQSIVCEITVAYCLSPGVYASASTTTRIDRFATQVKVSNLLTAREENNSSAMTGSLPVRRAKALGCERGGLGSVIAKVSFGVRLRREVICRFFNYITPKFYRYDIVFSRAKLLLFVILGVWCPLCPISVKFTRTNT